MAASPFTYANCSCTTHTVTCKPPCIPNSVVPVKANCFNFRPSYTPRNQLSVFGQELSMALKSGEKARTRTQSPRHRQTRRNKQVCSELLNHRHAKFLRAMILTLIPATKQPGREADHMQPSSVWVKKLYLHSPIRLHGVVHRQQYLHLHKFLVPKIY